MKKIKLSDCTMEIPNSWFDIKLDVYNALADLEQQEAVEEMDEADYSSKFLSIVIGKSEDEIKGLKPDDFLLLFKEILALTTSPIPRVEDRVLTVNNKTYVFDDVISNASIGVWADLNQLTKEVTNNNDFFKLAHKVAGIFIRPVKKERSFLLSGKKKLGFKIKPSDYRVEKYNYDSAQLNQEIFYEYLSVPYYVELAGFFLTLPTKLKKTSQYSTQSLKTAS